MAKYKVNKPNSKVGSLAITTAVLVVLGVILLIVGFNTKIGLWLQRSGIVLLVCAVPFLLGIVYTIINNKLKEM